MGMPPAFLFMEDDGARLAFEAELLLNPVNSVLEGCDRHLRAFRRIQAQGEKILAALRASRCEGRLTSPLSGYYDQSARAAATV